MIEILQKWTEDNECLINNPALYLLKELKEASELAMENMNSFIYELKELLTASDQTPETFGDALAPLHNMLEAIGDIPDLSDEIV